MMDAADPSKFTQPGVSTRGEWTALLEDLLQGIVHASNNRFTALMSLAQLAELDGGSTDDGTMMRQELARLHEVVSWVGALIAPPAQAEALELHAVLNVALAMHALHPRMRSIGCTLEREGDIPPVRTRRAALLRLLLLLVDAATRAGDASHEKAVVVRLSADGDTVRLAVFARAPVSPDAAALAPSCGCTLEAREGQWVLELPSLAALRRSERVETTRSPGADA